MADDTQTPDVKDEGTAAVVMAPASGGQLHAPHKHARLFLILGVVFLVAASIASVKLLKSREKESKSYPLPAKVDSVTCSQKQPNGDIKWIYAVNNDERYCASAWSYINKGLDNSMADPMNVPPIYTLKDNTHEPYTRTINDIKGKKTSAKGQDTITGYDSYIPLDSKGKKYVQCTNTAHPNSASFKDAEKDIDFKVRFTNTGSTTWNVKENVRLVVPNNNVTFGKYFFIGQFQVVTSSGSLEKRDEVKQGETAEFSAKLALPTKSGNPKDNWYVMFWVMSDKNNKPFGEIAYCSMDHHSSTPLVKTPALYVVPRTTN